MIFRFRFSYNVYGKGLVIRVRSFTNRLELYQEKRNKKEKVEKVRSDLERRKKTKRCGVLKTKLNSLFSYFNFFKK